MTNKNVFNAMRDIDAQLILDAAPAKRGEQNKKPMWVKWVSIAACLSLFVAGGLFGIIFHSPDTPDNSILSYFVITTQAADGESTELSVSSSIISSEKPKYNLFGHNMPLFHFDVEPSGLKSNEAVYQRFDISISYNGTTVTASDKDEHISIAYLASAHSSQMYGYTIFGWFTEPTDIVVTITDKESKEVVEEMTVNVKYDANRQEYELKLTSLDTEYTK